MLPFSHDGRPRESGRWCRRCPATLAAFEICARSTATCSGISKLNCMGGEFGQTREWDHDLAAPRDLPRAQGPPAARPRSQPGLSRSRRCTSWTCPEATVDRLQRPRGDRVLRPAIEGPAISSSSELHARRQRDAARRSRGERYAGDQLAPPLRRLERRRGRVPADAIRTATEALGQLTVPPSPT